MHRNNRMTMASDVGQVYIFHHNIVVSLNLFAAQNQYLLALTTAHSSRLRMGRILGQRLNAGSWNVRQQNSRLQTCAEPLSCRPDAQSHIDMERK